jgi:hypothetical protein
MPVRFRLIEVFDQRDVCGRGCQPRTILRLRVQDRGRRAIDRTCRFVYEGTARQVRRGGAQRMDGYHARSHDRRNADTESAALSATSSLT